MGSFSLGLDARRICVTLLETMPSPRLYLLDANALLHRAFHALPPLTNPDGMVVNAVYGFMMATLKLIKQDKPDAFIACWDTAAATFRHEAFEAYKAQREEKGPELYDQIPLIQEGLTALSIPSLFLDGYEADDVIGTMAMRAKKAGWEVTIVTGDKDAYQLIQPGISVLAFKKGVSEMVRIDEKALFALFQLTPAQFLEYKILRGDPSDNIPGVKGIGEKGAAELLQTYGTLERIMMAAHDPQSSLSAGMRKKLLEGAPVLEPTRMLVTIRTDVPIEWVVASQVFDVKAPVFLEFLERMGFYSLLGDGNQIEKRREGSSKKEEKTGESGSQNAQREKPIFKQETVTRETWSVWEKALTAAEWIAIGELGVVSQPALDDSDGLLCVFEGTSLRIPRSVLLHAETRVSMQHLLQKKADKLVMCGAKELLHRWKKEFEWDLPRIGMDIQLAAYVLDATLGEATVEEILSHFSEEKEASLEKRDQIEWILPLRERLSERLKGEDRKEILDRFELPLIPVLFEMERTGIMIDTAYLRALEKTFQAARQTIHREMEQAVGEAFNPASPAQLAHILFETLKLPTEGIKRGKTGFSTASAELEKLRGKHPIIEWIEEHREISKLLSTYIETLPTQVDAHQRVHTTFHQAGTTTGRLSSSDPNLQNIPIRTELGRQIRRAFVARPGCVLLSCDYAQIELRLAAAMAKDERMIQAFAQGEDIHKTTAAAMWHVSLDEVTADQRRAAKAVNFGVLYGQGAFGLSAAAGVTFAEAKEFIERYFSYYQRLKAYLEETRQFARKNGYVMTLFGRRRPIPELLSPVAQVRAQAERMAINMPIQGTEADILKLAMIDLAKRLPEWSSDTRMILQVHDELVFEVPETEVAGVAAHIRVAMQTMVDVGVPLLVEAKVGKNWEEMKKI